MGAFRSIGTVTVGFNTAISPGSPPGFQAGDILVCGYVQHAGTAVAPDLTSFGFTQKSDNTTVKGVVLYTKTAVGGDAMPSAAFGVDFQCCVCAAYTGLTETLDQASVQRGANTTANMNFPSFTAPPSSNVIAIGLAFRNNGTATGVTISNYASFTQRATNIPNASGRPVMCFEDQIMTTPQSGTLGSQTTSPADSVNQTNGAVIIFLQSIAAAGLPPGENDLPARIYARPYPSDIHQFYQIPLALRSVPVAAPPLTNIDMSVPKGRYFPNSLRSYEQNLLQSTLAGKDRVLTPVDWDYGFPSALDRMLTCLRDESHGLTANELTALTTYPPYLEYNWPNPQIARRLNQSYDAPINICLFGKDKILNSGPQNNMWDPTPARPFPVSLRSFDQSGLALYNTVPLKPPLSEANQPVPIQVRRPVQDFIMGTPLTLLSFLTTVPPRSFGQDMPIRRSYSSAYNGFTHSSLPLLQIPTAIPPAGRTFDQTLPPRRVRSNSLYEISVRSNFLIPPVPPPFTQPGQTAGPGGRIILLPKKQGETVNRQFDFISRLGAGELLTSAVVFASVYSGIDLNPQAIVYGGATIRGTIVNQGLTAGITGVLYELLCKVTTSLGQTLEMAAFWVVEPDLP